MRPLLILFLSANAINLSVLPTVRLSLNCILLIGTLSLFLELNLRKEGMIIQAEL